MEEEKKKKKNKKKKYKQTKTPEALSVGTGESASADQIHVNRFEQTHTVVIPNDVPKTDVGLDRHDTNGTEGVSLEERIKQLQKEKDAYIKKEADLGMEISQLQNEKDFWLQKEAGYKEKINQLVDEASTMRLKGVGLEEKIIQLERERESLVQKENTAKETISSLNADNTRLHTQRASGNEDMNSEMLAAQALVEKLLSEKAELVEKVNELYAELDPRSITAELSSSVGSDPTVGTIESARGAESSALVSDPTGGTAESPEGGIIADPIFESGERMSLLGENMKPMENVGNHSQKDVGNYVNHEDTAVIPKSETIASGEIMQIPLNGVVTKLEWETSRSDKTSDVPISDAPLIGAPFRLISFVARYVSGADLVNKSSVHSGR